MKNESAYTKKLTALLKKVKDAHQPSPHTPADPVTELVIAYLQWNSSRKLAHAAHDRLMKQMVDNNDLRVSHPHEIVNLIGSEYPRSEERAARLHEALQEIFNREHTVALEHLSSQGKKQARTYLDSLPGMVSYVSSRVMLISFGAHALPVDDLLRDKLIAEEAADPDASVEEVAAFLERQIKAGDALQYHLSLDEWSTAGGVKKTAGSYRKPAPAPLKISPAKPAPAKPVPSKAAAKPSAKSESKTSTSPTAKSSAKTTKKSTKKTTKKTTKKSTKSRK